MVNKIIKEIEKRIETWKADRQNTQDDKYNNYLYNRQIDSSIDDIVILELKDLLDFANEVADVQ